MLVIMVSVSCGDGVEASSRAFQCKRYLRNAEAPPTTPPAHKRHMIVTIISCRSQNIKLEAMEIVIVGAGADVVEHVEIQ
jgi:hypothetical protein